MWQDKLSQAGYTEETAPPPIKKEINLLSQFQSETDGLEQKMKKEGINTTASEVLQIDINESKEMEQKQGITIENKIDSYMKNKPHFDKMQVAAAAARGNKKAEEAAATAPAQAVGVLAQPPAPAQPAQPQVQLQMQEESGGGGVWFWVGILGLGALAYFGINKK